MSILQTTELKKYYGAKPNITRALDGVTLSIEKGEFVAIVGTSGSGKSTLLNMIGGLDVPTSGKVIVDGRELSTITLPEVGTSSPPIIFSSVDLPLPEVPTIATNSPFSMERVTPSKALVMFGFAP